jgi:MFS superfamily sulfate permease-like transporter
VLPGFRMLASYRTGWASHDVVAGLVLTTLLVPQWMAYAELAGLPAITGLYTSILCLLEYEVFGPSRILVLGPDSSLGPMIAATILPLLAAGGDRNARSLSPRCSRCSSVRSWPSEERSDWDSSRTCSQSRP